MEPLEVDFQEEIVQIPERSSISPSSSMKKEIEANGLQHKDDDVEVNDVLQFILGKAGGSNTNSYETSSITPSCSDSLKKTDESFNNSNEEFSGDKQNSDIEDKQFKLATYFNII
jgi:hypothetical protein